MRSRPKPADAETVARRLELLSRELAATRAGGEIEAAQRGASATIRPPEPAADLADEPVPRAPDAIPLPGRHAARPETARGGLLAVVPRTLRGRVLIGPAQAAVLAVAVAIGLAVTTWWVVRGDPEIAPVAAPVATASALVPVPSGSASTSGPGEQAPGEQGPGEQGLGEQGLGADSQTELIVDVAGKVRRPGIAVLPAGARVIDALQAAGGPRKGVDTTSLNLARPLVDGEQILVGIEPAPGAPGAAPPAVGGPGGPGGAETSAGPLVNLNSADQTQLETLPGVGPVTAAAILEWRGRHGAFSNVQELIEVNGIGEATLARLLPFVTL